MQGLIADAQCFTPVQLQRGLAQQEFGLMARVVFRMWGVNATADFGEIVFNLIDAELMTRTDQDRREMLRPPIERVALLPVVPVSVVHRRDLRVQVLGVQRLDAQARTLERHASGQSVEALIAEERARSPAYGGRTVFGEAKPPRRLRISARWGGSAAPARGKRKTLGGLAALQTTPKTLTA